MSYIDAAIINDGKIVRVWERDSNGKLNSINYNAEYYCYTPDERGEYNTLFTDRFQRVNKHTFKNQYELKAFVKKHNETSSDPIFESDIPADLKILSKFYYKAPIPDLHLTFFDIETDADLENKGWPTINDPYGDVISIAFYHQWKDEFVLIATPPSAYTGELPTAEECGVDRLVYTTTEDELLAAFLVEIDESDYLSGWNSDVYDIPYIIASLEAYITKDQALTALCRDGIPAKKRLIPQRFGGGDEFLAYKLIGRVNIDYLDLYKKYTFTQLPSYSLENVAEHELKYGKLNYTGTLPDLYKNDFLKFLKYNVHDVRLLRDLEKKLSFMDIVNRYGHDCCCRMHDVMGTVVGLDQALITYAHHELNQLVPDKGADLGLPEYISTVAKAGGSLDKYCGAFVYDMDTFDLNGNVTSTKKGLQGFIGSMDITSEYPNAIISNNISIETMTPYADRSKGDIVWSTRMSYDRTTVEDLQESMDFTESVSGGQSEFILKRTYIKRDAERTGNWNRVETQEGYTWGARNEVIGIVPRVLMMWFDQRLEQKAKMAKHYNKKVKILNRFNIDITKLPDDQELRRIMDANDYGYYIHHVAREGHYKRLQHITKIKLNSLYGCIGNAYSHFYNLAAAEACTLCGQGIVMYMGEQCAEVIEGTADLSADCIQYGDTDSIYFRIPEVIVENDDAVIYADYVAETVNKRFRDYMKKTHNCNDWQADRITGAREVVADRALFTDKKRYAMHLINLDGYPVDKLKIMGLDVVKSTTPPKLKKFLTEILERLLREGENEEQLAKFIINFRNQFNSEFTPEDFGEPKGVTGVDDYTNRLYIRGLWELDNSRSNELIGTQGLSTEQRLEITKAKKDGTRWEKIIKGKRVMVPGHVRASINWNAILDAKGDNITQRITTGVKIRTYYLMKNEYDISNIAIPIDIAVYPDWFMELPFDMAKMEALLIDNKVQILYNSMSWMIPTVASAELENVFGF